jgi:valyl-tRNA synthetase
MKTLNLDHIKIFINFLAGRQASSIVDDDSLKLTPSSTRKVWKYWLNNNRPWCLSRQLWWGHSIPMYRCSINKKSSEYQWIAAKSIDIEQDQDVIDTWFSSGLLPLSIFYNKTSQEFPTTLLDTGYDIMFFWVARMVMLVNIRLYDYVLEKSFF